MRVILAGYNLDRENIEEIKRLLKEIASYLENRERTQKEENLLEKINEFLNRENLTPETISAAYARISRDPRPVNELREIARKEVERARKSNVNIIFGLGHSSIAEHAVFNLDIIGVSRYAVEEIEKYRLCSFTEKSQRYVLFENDYTIPEELKGSSLLKPFKETIELQNRAYNTFFKKLKEYFYEKYSDKIANSKEKSKIENLAKEDARYCISLATQTQLGATVNARNLELMIRRFLSSPISEIKELGEKIFQEIQGIAPSVIKYTQPTEYFKKTYPELREKAQEIIKNLELKYKSKNSEDVKLISWTEQGEDIIIASLLHSSTQKSMNECLFLARTMSREQKREFIKTSFKYMKSYDAVLREFENVDLIFELIMSASCFAQLKRHRMATIIKQDYNPELGFVIPTSIKDCGLEKDFCELIEKTNEVFYRIEKYNPLIAPYILTNSHKRRILLKVNARELYHISRLRADKEAQWEIREKAQKMIELAKEKMPLIFILATGKDKFEEKFKKLFEK
ncbi:FAD-dependent thymidylate synthase [Candidatus Aminicenantes bacterium AC-335-K20]|nr:FAD-dependent thymidylate synthase [SCandidatus Aminicenantes bacterium Aminicenantia_JdfR_composite]MCP2597896.1 FAD-dependent thymidylate synthase [Candidatus Aminicenantes bacterium AC-335-L06]MCP2619453.1 FAD-dependent thymidylate synthase [Candidatus Aminicenantes bacterium AC-335-K20]